MHLSDYSQSSNNIVNLTLIYINYPMVKLFSLYVILLVITEPIDNIKWGFTV